MGWWSATIMGGDTPLDMEHAIGKLLNGETGKETLENSQDELVQTGIDSILNRWGCGEPHEAFYINEKSIGFQVLAYLMLKHGCEIHPSTQEAFLKWIPKDEWASEDDERKGYIDNLIEAIQNYDGKPMKLKNEGLFEVFAKKFGG
jgi:hypothetical protein